MTSIIALEVTKSGKRAMHVLLDDELGRLTLRRLRPWHRMLARGLAARLDRRLAGGAPPEENALLAARAMFLTSAGFRRGLAASLRQILAAASPGAAVSAAAAPSPDTAASPGAGLRPQAGLTGRPHVPVCRDQIAGAAPGLAGLAGFLAWPGPVPARGVAMVSQLLADGRGPLYLAGSRDDLNAVIEQAAQALIR